MRKRSLKESPGRFPCSRIMVSTVRIIVSGFGRSCPCSGGLACGYVTWCSSRSRRFREGASCSGRIKNQTPIKLPLHPEIRASLEKVGKGREYFFWSGEGNPKSCVGDWQRTFRRLSALAGVNSCYRWRHTFATDLLSKGVPVEVAAILGNSARIVEKHYAQWIQSRQNALEKAVKATW